MTENGIRAHHLGYLLQVDQAYLQYERAGFSPYEARMRASSDVREWMKSVLWDMSAATLRDPVNTEYYLDVVGTEKSNVFSVARNFATALLGLYHLSQEEILVHSQKDSICQACVIGSHCEEETYEYDMPYMRDVIRIADQLDISYKFVDGVLSISGTDLKRILREMNISEMEFANDSTRF